MKKYIAYILFMINILNAKAASPNIHLIVDNFPIIDFFKLYSLADGIAIGRDIRNSQTDIPRRINCQSIFKITKAIKGEYSKNEIMYSSVDYEVKNEDYTPDNLQLKLFKFIENDSARYFIEITRLSDKLEFHRVNLDVINRPTYLLQIYEELQKSDAYYEILDTCSFDSINNRKIIYKKYCGEMKNGLPYGEWTTNMRYINLYDEGKSQDTAIFWCKCMFDENGMLDNEELEVLNNDTVTITNWNNGVFKNQKSYNDEFLLFRNENVEEEYSIQKNKANILKSKATTMYKSDDYDLIPHNAHSFNNYFSRINGFENEKWEKLEDYQNDEFDFTQYSLLNPNYVAVKYVYHKGAKLKSSIETVYNCERANWINDDDTIQTKTNIKKRIINFGPRILFDSDGKPCKIEIYDEKGVKQEEYDVECKKK
jgi:hypothetical protein